MQFHAGVIQAIHLDGLVAWARQHQSHLVLTHAVGDFVATGEALVTVCRGSGDLGTSERELSGMIALGDERTIQQIRPLPSGSWSTSPSWRYRLR